MSKLEKTFPTANILFLEEDHSDMFVKFSNHRDICRLGIDTRVYLSSAELAAVCALMGKIPTVEEYMEQVKMLGNVSGEVYRYMNFDQIKEFVDIANKAELAA